MLQGEVQKMQNMVQSMKSKTQQNSSFLAESSFFGENSVSSQMRPQSQGTPNGKLAPSFMSSHWNSTSSQQPPFSQIQNLNDPRMAGSPSPMKGRIDPNMSQFAIRQNFDPSKNGLEQQLQSMGMHDMSILKSKVSLTAT